MVFFAGDAEPPATISAPSSRGLGRRPLKAVTPVRIRSGLHQPRSAEALTREKRGQEPRCICTGGRPGTHQDAGCAWGGEESREVRAGALRSARSRPSPSGAAAPSANLRSALWPPALIPAWRCASQCYSYWCGGPGAMAILALGATAPGRGDGVSCQRHLGCWGSGVSVTRAGGEAARASYGLAGKRCRRHIGCQGHQRDMDLCWKLGICDISGRCAARPAASGRR